jgi:Kef-type K+ transport system membrane component KefB
MWRPWFIPGPVFRRAVGVLSLVEGIYAILLIAATTHLNLLTIASAAMVVGQSCYGTIGMMKVGHCGCQLSDQAPKKERAARTVLLLLRNLLLLVIIILSLKLGTSPIRLISHGNDLGIAALALALLPIVYLTIRKCWLQLEAAAI